MVPVAVGHWSPSSGVRKIRLAVEYADGSPERIHLVDAFRLSKAVSDLSGGHGLANRPLNEKRKQLLEERDELPQRMKNRLALALG